MKSFLALFFMMVPVWAQSPLPDLPDETVIATFSDGVRMTMGDFKRIYAVLPPENQQQAMQNRQGFLQQWSLMRKLASLAEGDKLDQLSPSKDALEYYRLVILSQAKMGRAMQETTVVPSQVQKYYDENKSRYQQVHVRAIYIGFGGQKRTEADARAKASRLLAAARIGADFARLARENSDDETSRVKDGDFATLRPNDNVPDAVREAIFKLKEGEVSEPIRQPNGYYIFRAETISVRPLPDVRDEIFTELKQKLYQEWLDKTNREAIVIYNSPVFIGAIPGLPPTSAAQPKK